MILMQKKHFNINDIIKGEEKMNTYYEQLLNYNGADELIEVVKKWEIISQNIIQRPINVPIILPDLFLYTQSGYGKTKLLSLLAEYIDSKKNLMTFYGDVKFLEFKLNYCKPDYVFNEIYRFLETIQVAAGFRNEFKGIVRINISEWVGHHKEKYFLDFLQLLKNNTSNWLIILSISNIKENEKTKEMESVISMFLRIESVTLHMLSDKELAEYASSFLMKYGFELDDGAKSVLENSIEVLRKNEYFNGLSTIEDMCNDIAYLLFSEQTMTDRIITADMLADFSSESEYIKRTIMKIKHTVTLGF